ncbi:BnaC03g30730D [Brassica napus]|uniref:(rape) hypothetical protein n=1 Tax=Brassica napus TaxID=3708 RepID=A0A078FYB2_BRANA|nr:unnamed protein product [Brassica napus]CDY18001.1 BnaC03g30730D [Brassica napus]
MIVCVLVSLLTKEEAFLTLSYGHDLRIPTLLHLLLCPFLSAPVSPTSSCDDHNPFHSTVSATMTLRRVLNLETADE